MGRDAPRDRRQPNVFDEEPTLGGFGTGVRAAELFRRAGAERLGGTLYELAAGSRGVPLHFHHGNEEVLIVLSGSPTLRTSDGRRALAAGDVVAFRAGSRGVHAVENDTDETIRYLMTSTRRQPDVVEYPDAGTIRATTRSVFDGPPAADAAPDAVNIVFDRATAVDS